MTAVDEVGDVAPARFWPKAFEAFFTPRRRRSTLFVVVALLVALFVMPALWGSTFWIKNFTSAAVFAIVAGATGFLYGRVGLVALGQVAPYAVGTWLALRLGFATSLPFPVLILLSGLLAMVVGVVLGLPALRLSGLYLALATLFMAASIILIVGQVKFPNGGPGFRGVYLTQANTELLRRPDIATGDLSYYRYAVICAALLFGVAAAHLTAKPGRSWASMRQSEAAALAAGINITAYKLWAWALASFMTGAAGALLAGLVGAPTIFKFTIVDSILFMAIAVMGGVATLWGGVIAGLLAAVLPEILEKIGFSSDWGLIIFGIGLLANLLITSAVLDRAGVKE